VIQFLTNDTIDKSRWDDCISSAINGNLNAYSWYLDIVSPGWCALIEGEYERVFPLPVSSRVGFRYIMQPFFTQQLGLFYRSLPSKDILTRFIKSIPPEYKYIDINLNTSNRLPDNESTEDLTNIELDLISDYDKIAAGYQNNLKRNLKKAVQHKLTISKHVRPEEIISLFLKNKGQTLTNLGEEQYALIQRIAYESTHKGIGEIWGAYDEYNELTAGILWVTSHQKTIFLFSAVSENGKAYFAMPWLIDSYIRQSAGKPLTLDFEGSNYEGLARFYSSFGAKKVIYQRYFCNSLPLPYRLALQLWRKARLFLKKYPALLKQ
jgi:hypothetical protein